MSQFVCDKVSFSYEGQTVLAEINFSVEHGDYLCIVGENGAGKSTLIRGILDLKKPTSGKIIMGDNLKSNQIGYLPQQTAIQKDFPASVYEIVLSGCLNNLGFFPFYKKSDKNNALSQMKLLGIENLKNKCYRELSGGQQQRVLLARALCASKELLILDEPVSGLDPIMTGDLYRLIERINKEEHRTIIMVSHDIQGVLPYATHILHLSNKQIFYGTKEAYENSDIGTYFLGGGKID